jgi:hypothetical protein
LKRAKRDSTRRVGEMAFQLISSTGAAAIHSAPTTVERVSEARLPTAGAASRYLRTKKEMMGHLVELV